MAAPRTATDTLLASLRTATNLSLADLADLHGLATSSPRAGASRDEILSRNLWRDELQHFSRTLQDRVLAQDLQTALRENRSLETVRRERARRAEPRVKATPGVHAQTQAEVVQGTTSYLARKQAQARSQKTANPSGTTTIPSSPTSPCIVQDPVCFICLCPPDVVRRLPCSHIFCSPCLNQLFLLASKDEAYNPASCCKQSIDLEYAFGAWSYEEIKAYKEASEKFKLPNRLYCSNKRCSAFLGCVQPSRRIKMCSKCPARTCAACKAPAHPSIQVCVADPDAVAAAKLVKQLKGTKCQKCGRVILRKGGCTHVHEISLADLQGLNSLATSSVRMGASADEVLARQLWREELQRFSGTLRDRVLAQDLQ
ncbi:hypothetical protein JCM11251_002776 [Rhodosporidiobolus azoricus]